MREGPLEAPFDQMTLCEKADRYTEQLQSQSEGRGHDMVALKMILHEARKLERRRCGSRDERRKSDAKWRFILNQVRGSELAGVSPCTIRADLAVKYPFQGMLSARDMRRAYCEKQELIYNQNLSLGILPRKTSCSSFSQPRSCPSSRSSSDSGSVER